MIPQDKVTAAIKSFISEDGVATEQEREARRKWNTIFRRAPAGAMQRLAIAFYYAKELISIKDSQNQADQDLLNEYRALREQVESQLTEEDLQYLVDNMDEKKKQYYEKLLKAKQKEAAKAGGQEAAAGVTPQASQQQPAA